MLAQLRQAISAAPRAPLTISCQKMFLPRVSVRPSPALPAHRECHTEPATQTFASLMRNCKVTAMGDPVGKTVVGRIYHVVGDDLYIDFGHKFGCVCTKPRFVSRRVKMDHIRVTVSGRGGGTTSGAPR